MLRAELSFLAVEVVRSISLELRGREFNPSVAPLQFSSFKSPFAVENSAASA